MRTRLEGNKILGPAFSFLSLLSPRPTTLALYGIPFLGRNHFRHGRLMFNQFRRLRFHPKRTDSLLLLIRVYYRQRRLRWSVGYLKNVWLFRQLLHNRQRRVQLLIERHSHIWQFLPVGNTRLVERQLFRFLGSLFLRLPRFRQRLLKPVDGVEQTLRVLNMGGDLGKRPA